MHPALLLDDDALANDPAFQQLLAQQRAEIAYVAANFDYSVFAGAQGALSGSAFQAYDAFMEKADALLQGDLKQYRTEGALVTGGDGPQFKNSTGDN